MNEYVLRKLLQFKDNSYFIIFSCENVYNYIHKENRRNEKLFYIALTQDIKNIIEEKTIETITFLDVLKINKSYIDTNILLNSEYTPFQQWQQPFYNAVDIEEVDGINYKDLLNIKCISEIKQIKDKMKLWK